MERAPEGINKYFKMVRIFSSVFASAGGMAAPFVAQTSSIHPTVPIAIFGIVSVIAGKGRSDRLRKTQ